MATWLFFNIDPLPNVVIDYTNGFERFGVRMVHPDTSEHHEIFTCSNDASMIGRLRKGIELDVPDHGKIKLAYRRLLFKNRWHVLFNNIQLSGLRIT